MVASLMHSTPARLKNVAGPQRAGQEVVRFAVAVLTLHDIITDRVIVSALVRVKIWGADGRVVYSDERLIGAHHPEKDEELAHLTAETAHACLQWAPVSLGGVFALLAVLLEPARETRQGVRALRFLLVESYPPDLQQAGLASALADLAAPLTSRDIDVETDVASDARGEVGARRWCSAPPRRRCATSTRRPTLTMVGWR